MSDPRTTRREAAGLLSSAAAGEEEVQRPRVCYRSLMSANSVAFAAANAHIKVLYFSS